MSTNRKNWNVNRRGVECLVSLIAICSAASADPVALNISGALTSSMLDGVTVGAGQYTPEQLSTVAGAVGTASAGGFTGVSLWGLLGGTATGTSDVVTNAGKNAILRTYLLATNTQGAQFVISLGEVDPFFGGAATTSPFVSYAGGDGNPALIFPSQNAAGRDVNDLASLQVLSVAAPAPGAGGASTSFVLAGNVARPGVYTSSSLKSLPSTTEKVSGDTYTGVNLWSFLGAGTTNEFDEYVLAEGTDGYEVLLSLAELDPALGAPNDLVPYSDTAGQFPADGVARIVIPGDNHAGRYVSNLSLLEVGSVPEPSTILLLCSGLAAFAAVRRIAAKPSVSERDSTFS